MKQRNKIVKPAAIALNDKNNDKNKQNKIQVIVRVAAIMRILSEHPEGLSLAAIAKKVNLPRSTIQRLIRTLEIEDLVESIGPAGGFRLGTALGRLINRTQTNVIDVVRPHLHQLSKTLNETTIFSHFSGLQTMVIEQVIAERVMRIVIPLGTNSYPCYMRPDGLVMLSYFSQEKVVEMLEEHFAQLSDGKVKLAHLLELIKEIKLQGFAVIESLEDPFEGISMISVLIETYMGIYALNVVAPSSRFRDQLKEFVHELKLAKQAIEDKIGLR